MKLKKLVNSNKLKMKIIISESQLKRLACRLIQEEENKIKHTLNKKSYGTKR